MRHFTHLKEPSLWQLAWPVVFLFTFQVSSSKARALLFKIERMNSGYYIGTFCFVFCIVSVIIYTIRRRNRTVQHTVTHHPHMAMPSPHAPQIVVTQPVTPVQMAHVVTPPPMMHSPVVYQVNAPSQPGSPYRHY